LTPIGPVLAAAAGAAIVTGLSGGNLAQIVKAASIAAITAGAFQGLNEFVGGLAQQGISQSGQYLANVTGSALVGCASSAASGGSCASGAAAAAVSAGLAPVTNSVFKNAKYDIGERIGGTIVQATVGGLASVAGGGKFANGAATAAFQYNVALGPVSDPRMNARAQEVPDEKGYTTKPSTVFKFNEAMREGERNFSLTDDNRWQWAPGAATIKNSGTVVGGTNFGGFYTNGSLEVQWGPSMSGSFHTVTSNGGIIVATPMYPTTSPGNGPVDPTLGTVRVAPYVGY